MPYQLWTSLSIPGIKSSGQDFSQLLALASPHRVSSDSFRRPCGRKEVGRERFETVPYGSPPACRRQAPRISTNFHITEKKSAPRRCEAFPDNCFKIPASKFLMLTG
jgi:hypothetical protein